MAGVVKAKRVLLLSIGCLAAASGCFWRSYPARMRTHGELLVAFARKAQDLVVTGRFNAESLPELTYPLARATTFAADARRHAAPPPESLPAFEQLLERYRAFVDLADRARREPAASHQLPAALAAVEEAARDVNAALAREGR